MNYIKSLHIEGFKKFTSLDVEFNEHMNIRPSTLNKLYVAMTRSRGDLYLMKASTFKAIRDSYITK